MKHKIKTVVFKILDVLPPKTGYVLYHNLQNIFDKIGVESKIKRSEITYHKFDSICKELKFDLKNKTLLEIGSGWFPIMPYFFKYMSRISTVYTYDINQHYQKKSMLDFNSVFSKMYNKNIQPEKSNKFNLPSDIHYYPKHNIVTATLPTVDIIFSRYVLSHVSPDDIVGMHLKFKNTMAKGTYIVHFISPSDLRQHSDSSLSLQDFLKYSKAEWDKIQTKFDYHNRLRLPQFLEVFKSLELEVVYLSYESLEQGTPKYQLFKELELHEEFKKYSDEELTAGNIVVVLKL